MMNKHYECFTPWGKTEWLVFENCREEALFPVQKCRGDAAFDLFSDPSWVEYKPVHNGIYDIYRYEIPTGIKVEIPKGFYGKIENRSGFVKKSSLRVTAGIIDSGYRGEVIIMMDSFIPGSLNAEIPILTQYLEQSNAIAQLLIIPHLTSINSYQKERGEKGFGSTNTGE